MSNINYFSNAIKEIYKTRGTTAFSNARIFHALLDDIVPTLNSERKIFRSAVDDSLLRELSVFFNGRASNKEFEVVRLKKKIEDNNGLNEEWSLFIIESFIMASDDRIDIHSVFNADDNSKTQKKCKEKISASGRQQKYILDNGATYEGDFYNGNAHGMGKIEYPNGDSYIGEFVDGYLSGKGKYIYADGSIYEGDFVRNDRNGRGRFIFKSGNVYEGDWLENKRNGKGTLISVKGFTYQGDFKNNVYSGKGKYKSVDGNVYEGDFEDGKCNGKGKLTYANGDVYEGDFKDNVCSGTGKLLLKNGDTYEGQFSDGKITGYGTMIENGVKQKGHFEAGKLIKAQENSTYKSTESDKYSSSEIALLYKRESLTRKLNSFGLFEFNKKQEIKKQLNDIEVELKMLKNAALSRKLENNTDKSSNKVLVMKVDELFSVSGRGTILRGKIKCVRIKSGDSITVEGRKYAISAIEMNQKILKYAEKGDEVSILVKGLNKRDVDKESLVYMSIQ